ncbi:ribosomal protein S6 modification protein [Pantoea agglomerans]|nr:ribosomal protein S6 modification protein [Pantoea agglomerans]
MKIAILSRDETLYSSRRLREEAAARGHQVRIIDPLSCYMNINPASPAVHYCGEPPVRRLSRASATLLPFMARPCCDSLRCAAAIR